MIGLSNHRITCQSVWHYIYSSCFIFFIKIKCKWDSSFIRMGGSHIVWISTENVNQVEGRKPKFSDSATCRQQLHIFLPLCLDKACLQHQRTLRIMSCPSLLLLIFLILRDMVDSHLFNKVSGVATAPHCLLSHTHRILSQTEVAPHVAVHSAIVVNWTTNLPRFAKILIT